MNLNIEEIKETIIEKFNATLDQIKESQSYIQAKEQYDQLPVKAQKSIITGIIAVIAIIIISIPLAFIASASSSITKFESSRELLRDLMKVERDNKMTPGQGFTLPPASLINQVRRNLEEEGLSEQQIANIAPYKKVAGSPEDSKLIPKALEQNGVEISLKKLNLKQILAISYQLHRKENAAKMINMDISVNAENDHYFDVYYKLVNFSLPVSEEDSKAEEDSSKKKRSRKRK